MWRDYHEFWLNAKIPVHIVRFEDVLYNTKATMNKLLKFVLNSYCIDETYLEKYIDLAVQEKAPEIYKPREGRSNSNCDKYTRVHLDYMYSYAGDLLTKLGYDEAFTGVLN